LGSIKNDILKSNIESLSKSEALLEILDEYLIVSKTDDMGIITYASQGFCKISGYSHDELVGQPHSIVRSPNMPSSIFEHLWDTIKKGKKWQGEIENYTKDGEPYWVDATITAEYDSYGNVIGYNAIRHHITDKKKLIELNNTLEDLVLEEVVKNRLKDKQLMQQTKAAQMGEMIDAIAHQWKQPLTAISLLSQTLDYKIDLGKEITNESIKNMTKETKFQIDHLLDTMDSFRKFFRDDETQELFSLKNLIDSTKDILESTLKSNYIHIIVNGDDSLKIKCIKSEFIHVFINLINNAKDVFNELSIKDRKITFDISQKEDKVIIKVIDNAGGIPQKILPYVFDANFTTKEEGKGTGIGLYMTKQILEKIDATIEAQNVVVDDTKGASFIITV
jgi:PAS domain S-box-containing protein